MRSVGMVKTWSMSLFFFFYFAQDLEAPESDAVGVPYTAQYAQVKASDC